MVCFGGLGLAIHFLAQLFFHPIDFLLNEDRADLILVGLLLRLVPVADEFLHAVEAAEFFDFFAFDFCVLASEGGEEGEDVFVLGLGGLWVVVLRVVDGEGVAVGGFGVVVHHRSIEGFNMAIYI